jgi:ATP-dependent helicase/nuclease subunit A
VADDAPPLPETDATIYAFSRNVVVAASAGTGKTYRLTALYVLLTLGLTSMGQPDARTPAPPVLPDRIVATTFSRAAAAEIAARVEKALRDLANWDGQAALQFEGVIRARLAALGMPLDVGELKGRAQDALTRWPSARVDTLHGVARRIVQRHSLAIGLAPGTRVLDEEEAQALSDLAVDEALGAALSEGGDRAEAARALVVSLGSVWATRIKVQRLLDRLDEEGLSPRDLALADHLADARALAISLHALARRLAALGSPTFREAAAALASALGPALDSPPGSDLLPAHAVPYLEELFSRRMPARGKRLPPDDELDDFIGALPGKTKGDRAAGLVALLRAAPALGPREALIRDLLDDARARLLSHKSRAGALGFGDLLRIASTTLRDRPEIARAVREEIDVLLVDEFQDTSRVQRDLVYLLREREDAGRARGASPTAQDLQRHGLFLVGDRKQSIYGFRGADVAVFSRIAAELAGPAAGVALALPEAAWKDVEPVADFVALRESRRSGAAILEFVNAFSSRDFAEDRPAGAPPRDFEITYGPAEHLEPAAGAPAPEARVTFVADDGSSPPDADPVVRESSGAAREAHVAAAFVACATAPTEGVPRLAYRDVAILARRRSSIPLVEIALARLEIPYVVAGRALYDAPEVRDIAALLRLLLDPRDRLAMATVLRGPMVALSDTSLAALSIPGRGLSVPLLGRWPTSKPNAEIVDPTELLPAERARLEAFRARFAEVRRAALRLPPGEAIRAAMAVFDLDRVLAALPRAEARLGNLDRLVTIARRRGGTLAAFVRWLERRMRDDADEAEAAVFSPEDDAVRLTTIHASKGLDFPLVVLVDLNAEPRSDHGGLGFVEIGGAPRLVVRHYAPRGASRALAPLATATLKAAQAEARAREQAERRRLTYVAITRAEHTLALIGSASDPRPGAALRTLANGLREGDLVSAVTEVAPAVTLLAAARPAPPTSIEPPPRLTIEQRPPRRGAGEAKPPPATPAPAREIAVDTAALALFRECPRRYRLRHLLGLEEPARSPQLDLFAEARDPAPITDLPPPIADDPALDPRPLHRAAHRVLAGLPLAAFGRPADPRALASRLAAEGMLDGDAETARLARAIAAFLDGPYAREARDAAIARDEPYLVIASGGARRPRRLLLRGAVDLRVDHGDGRVDVLEIRATRGRDDAPSHELGLRAAALAAQRASPGAIVRAGLVFLLGRPDPVWLRGRGPGGSIAPEDLARFEDDLAGAADAIARARHADRFEGVSLPTCMKLDCGFVPACHGAQPTS